ncbi:MAG: hypothetical protein PHF05_05215, partial [Candidatus Izemoplasmatales bacterium]|nr:hypothetical protein [Candidatus Izemoplasmatales bacterium]
LVSGSDVFFETEDSYTSKIIIEYSYLQDNILFSKLDRISVQKDSIDPNTNLSKYHFKKPSNSLSFKIWRIISEDNIRSTANGEYILSEENALSNVEVRVKQIIVDNDLITKERQYTDNIALKVYKFVMHFDLIDEEGNPIDIDRIVRLNVKFDVIQTGAFLKAKTYTYNFEIEETTFIPTAYFPYFINESVVRNIDSSFDENYTWMVTLGTFQSGANIPVIAPGDVNIDKTQLLTIDYVFDGIFYEEQIVIDEPYDKDDVINVIPGTTDPVTNLWEKINELFGSLDSAIEIIIAIAIGLAVIVVISLVFKVFNLAKGLIITSYKIIKFIVIGIPKGIIKFFMFLLVPKSDRKERKNVNRYF